jgi:recombinational DNA repair protein (RecF pathway)
LGALWRIVADAGFAPSLEECANCHAEMPDGEDAHFSHAAGGALCPNCVALAPGRRLPPSARQAIQFWLQGHAVVLESEAVKRAHQRLLREFIAQHLPDPRQLTAFDAWEASLFGN